MNEMYHASTNTLPPLAKLNSHAHLQNAIETRSSVHGIHILNVYVIAFQKMKCIMHPPTPTLPPFNTHTLPPTPIPTPTPTPNEPRKQITIEEKLRGVKGKSPKSVMPSPGKHSPKSAPL